MTTQYGIKGKKLSAAIVTQAQSHPKFTNVTNCNQLLNRAAILNGLNILGLIRYAAEFVA
jgi:hypothetical protein